jgi:hypothetical protein
MNTLHDDSLSTALKDAARRYELPSGATAQILDAATAAPQEHRRDSRGEASRWSRRRLALVAAVAIVLAVLGGSLTLAGLGVGHPHGSTTFAAGSATQIIAPLDTKHASVYGDSTTDWNTTVGRQASSQTPAIQQTKVVSVGSISLGVPANRFNTVLARLSGLATSVGGYVASSRSTAGSQAGGVSSGVIELRIPQKHFSSVVSKTERLGKVVSAETNSTDVTAEYVDYLSRIGALEASRSQYLAIMAKANSIGDILAIQAQLNVIESEIDQLEGQRNLLANQAAYGTLTVAINQGALALGHQSGVQRAWSQSVSGFVAGVEWIIRAAGPALFALLCLLALLLFGRFGWRAGQRRLI